MRFIREIPIEKITDKEYTELEARGFILKWTEDSIIVWADCMPEVEVVS